MTSKRKNEPPATSPIQAVAMHVYAGGMAKGLHDAGIEIVADLEPKEFKGFGRSSMEANLPKTPVISEEEEWEMKRFAGCQVCFGNPPCAGFSILGRRLDGSMANTRDGHIGHVRSTFEMFEVIRPRIWVIESVNRIMTSGRGVCASIEKMAREAGYAVTYWQHDHRAFGGVQRRQRTFAIVHDVDLVFPVVPTHPIVRVGDVLDGPVGEVMEYKPGAKKLWENTKPGEGPRDYLDHLEQIEGWSREKFREEFGARPTFWNVRWNREDFAPTLIGDPVGYCHPDEVRAPGHLEMARVAGFPEDWVWAGKNVHENWVFMSKASQPVPARALGDMIVKSLAADRRPHYDVAIVDQRYNQKKDEFKNVQDIVVRTWALAGY